MKAIGGYFELELYKGDEYHKKAIRLNTGRNAFEYILRTKKYRKVFLPYYTCDVMLEPINKLGLDYEFYHIDKTLRPVFNFKSLKFHDVFVYTNYFGVCDQQVKEVESRCDHLIVDNSQAFYSKPLPKVDTFYSPRKFFGIPDGAYLYTDKKLKTAFEKDISYKRIEHLLGRIDLGAEKFYHTFKENDNDLIGQPIKLMSNLTSRLLCGIDYESSGQKRRENFLYLHKHLKDRNQLKFDFTETTIPMVYPYLIHNGFELKKKLIENKVFIATYWPNINDWVKDKSALEMFLHNDLIPIAIDQRYTVSDLSIIINLLITK